MTAPQNGHPNVQYEAESANLPVNDPNVLEVLRAARAELDQLLAQRAGITRRIGTTKQAIIGLAKLFGGTVLQNAVLELIEHRATNRQSGFTRACRYLLTEANRPMTSTEVCEGLRQKFPELAARHKDLSASVTTVMNRLVGYGEASISGSAHGRRAWTWVAETAEVDQSGEDGHDSVALQYSAPIMATDAANLGSHRTGRSQL
jgi:hypothetical protein